MSFVFAQVMTRKEQTSTDRWTDKAEYNKMLAEIFSGLRED